MDGGQLDAPELTIQEAREQILEAHHMEKDVYKRQEGLQPVEKTVIDRCVHVIYRKYVENPLPENMPLLEDLYNALLTQDEPEARHVAAALEI